MGILTLPKSEIEYRNALIDAAEVGASKALMGAGILKPFLKLREAQRLYGAGVLSRWIKEGLVTVIKDGDHSASVRISRIELETVAKACNRSSYITELERKQL